ncbi:MAG: uL30 family ribosomal protein [Candidatus Aenigmarchaeota archaeon]|nr:uL30 family ribosomal protein [Candidatus Aenigmarchaeota archaeon]
MYIAIRLRGHAGVKGDIEETMMLLGLKAPNTCVVIPENAVNKGMLAKVKDYVAWGEADEKTISGLKITDKDSKVAIRFNPPSKGFRSLKMHYPKGDLGYRGKAINEFLQTFGKFDQIR